MLKQQYICHKNDETNNENKTHYSTPVPSNDAKKRQKLATGSEDTQAKCNFILFFEEGR